ncbi:MAG: GDP-mannose 4,6-dehydratase, partial [Dehalococcoidia bacterium]
MNVLVSGCAGFIGWKVSLLLLGEDHVVIGVDNVNDAYDTRLKEWRLAQLESHPRFHFHRLDIDDRKAIDGLIKDLPPTASSGFDAVIHLAARAGVRQSLENPWIYYQTNVEGTLNLLELCRAYGVGKFVLASTSSVYGFPNSNSDGPQSFREDMSTDHTLSPYSASKKAAEALCYAYHHLYG